MVGDLKEMWKRMAGRKGGKKSKRRNAKGIYTTFNFKKKPSGFAKKKKEKKFNRILL